MKQNYLRNVATIVLSAGLCLLAHVARSQTVQAFVFTGSVQSFVLPPCVNQVTLEVWGAEGGGVNLSQNSASGDGGKGGYARGSMTVAPNSTLHVYVGGFGQSSTNGLAAGGWNGGGSGYASSSGEPGNGGGGATDIRLNGQSLNDRVIVAGGGGGGGEDSGDPFGHGGGLTGVGYSAYDATQTSAGAGGAFGIGGSTAFGDGGGGGGGWYGGGTLSSQNIGTDTQGGGGGSGYTGTLTATSLIDGSSSMPNPNGGTMIGRTGNGYARITYSLNGTAVSVSNSVAGMCSGGSVNLNGTGVVSYTWLPVGNFSGSNSGTVNVSPTANTIFTVQGTNAQGCVTTATASVIINTAVPALTVSSSASSVCLGQSASVTASGAITYTWANPGISNGQLFVPSATAVYTVYGQNGCGTTSAVTTISVSQLPIPSTASPAVICENQSAFLNASGATSYTWMPGALTGSSTIVSPSTGTNIYTVTASNGTCQGTSQVTVTVNPNPTLSVVGSSTRICQGETVSISVSGANSYTWNPNTITGTSGIVSPAVTTLYDATGVNSFGCTSNASHIVIVDQPSPISGNLTSTVICPGSSVLLTASGASTYSWNTGPQTNTLLVSPSANTQYTVLATGSTNTCIASRVYSVNVAQPVLPVSNPTYVCVGVPATFTAGPGSNFSWSNGGGNIFMATYTAQATTIFTVSATVLAGPNLNCPASNTVMLGIYPSPTVNASASKTVICRREPLTITASGADTYQWSYNNFTTTAITYSSNSTTTLNLTVVGTDTNGCTGTGTYTVRVALCEGIGEHTGIAQVAVYPNPNTGNFTISADKDLQVTIVNALGQVVRQLELNATNGFKTDVSGLTPGVYFINDGKGTKAATVVVTQ